MSIEPIERPDDVRLIRDRADDILRPDAEVVADVHEQADTARADLVRARAAAVAPILATESLASLTRRASLLDRNGGDVVLLFLDLTTAGFLGIEPEGRRRDGRQVVLLGHLLDGRDVVRERGSRLVSEGRRDLILQHLDPALGDIRHGGQTARLDAGLDGTLDLADPANLARRSPA